MKRAMDIERKLAIRVLNKAIGDTYFTDITKTINICSPVLLNNVTYISYNKQIWHEMPPCSNT